MNQEPLTPEAEMKRLSRRGFLWAAMACIGGYTVYHELVTAKPAANDTLGWPFRRVLSINEKLEELYFSPRSLAAEYPVSRATMPKENGGYGVRDDPDFDPAKWKLKVVGAKQAALEVSLAEIQALPTHEMVTELRCIEGWSVIVHWTGCRLADFVAKFPPETLPPYMALETPNGNYYVGLDMPSALHPQTLLCYAMNGQPLELKHGAPLRLVAPTKYGVKNLKRIGTLTYSTTRPKDYWAELGYDWYTGL
jgi:DMSO/TMAO reductase YedYZ molybdopterin-dependent catalytic subunit